jgi:hypothetical protein
MVWPDVMVPVRSVKVSIGIPKRVFFNVSEFSTFLLPDTAVSADGVGAEQAPIKKRQAPNIKYLIVETRI